MVLPSRQQIRLLLPLGTAVALSLTGDSTLYAVLANQTEVLGISLASVGALLGVNRLIRIPGNPLAGVLHDRWGRRRLFLLGLLLGILSTFGYSLVRGFWPLFAARLLWGAAWALINVGGYTMILDRSTSADRGRMTGFYQVSYMLGLAISPILGGALTDALGFRPAVRICAAISGIGLVVALVALPETRPPSARSQVGGTRAGPRWSVAELAGVLRRVDRRILLAGYIYLVTFFVSNGVLMSTISLYLGQRWGESIALNGVAIGVSSLAGMLLALRALLGIVAGPAAGILSDRLRDRWVIARGGILLGVSGFLLLSLLSSFWAVPSGVVLVSLSATGLIAVLVALVGDLAADDRPGITMGGLATAGDIGSAIGPLLAYALATILDLRQIYLLCALALASGLLATLGKARDR
jgi:DHA1 family multidrug resistance protein-like MFS transporter